jgi:predicted transcriptional regulator
VTDQVSENRVSVVAIVTTSGLLADLGLPRDCLRLVLDSYFAAQRQRRSRLEIKITILEAISRGNQRLAHIMYYAKLPPRMCGSIVRTMEQQGLILILPPESGRKTKRYALTDRGRRALDSYLVIVKQLQLESSRGEEEGQLVPQLQTPVKA